MNSSAQQHEIAAAARMAEQADIPLAQRADMLVQIAMGAQNRATTGEQMEAVIGLYDRALELLSEQPTLARARICARRATALQALPAADTTFLEEAREIFETVLPMFMAEGEPAELAELHMNRGLTLQTLAGMHKASMGDAIRAYQQALKFFTAQAYPQEFAIIHNNLATAFLALPTRDPQGRMREALAVQSFEAALQVITLEAHPLEYAMLQNNLGNALQQVDSTHPVENHQRALAAYDEALRVRTREHSPLQYANTLANRAACCAQLATVTGDADLQAAMAGYREAGAVFLSCGETDRAALVHTALQELQGESTRPGPSSTQ